MVFLGIYRALYDYVPQSENEIGLSEGDLLMVLEKSADDDWWKAKKKGLAEDEDEPEGLIPNNYVEEAAPIQKAKALYDYTRQTDEELSFQEDAVLDVYDTTDPDWTLVGVDGDYGFAPANYIDVKNGIATAPIPSPSLLPPRPSPPAAPHAQYSFDAQQPPAPASPVHQSPAAALAGIIQKKSEQQTAPRSTYSPPPNVRSAPKRVQFTPSVSDDEEIPPPRLPTRPESQQFSPQFSPQYSPQLSPQPTQYASRRSPSPPPRSGAAPSVTFDRYDPPDERDRQPLTPLSASGYHLYNIYEYLTQPGKNKKMPTTLGINTVKGTLSLAPEKSRDGQQQEWTADNMEYYSQEGKHIFLELKRPSKSVDLHCGAKDTASEIMASLGELAGAAKASGLREVLAAGSGNSNVQRKAVMLFDFVAQGEDEVTVGLGDEVLIIDDSASDEWWKVRRLKNGKEGVVPSNYVEITASVPISTPSSHSARSGTNAGRSMVDQNRMEEEDLARQASKSQRRHESDSRADQRSKRDSNTKDSKSSAKPSKAPRRSPYSLSPFSIAFPEIEFSTWDPRYPPEDGTLRERTQWTRMTNSRFYLARRDIMLTNYIDLNKVRTWTDRSGSFKVEAEFLTMKDGKIHLHKINGVKIAVPVSKMSVEDLEYVERATGISLDDDKPLSDIKRRSTLRTKDSGTRSTSGISVEKKPSYDWFDFFLQCGVNPQICERYAQAFIRDQMGEENMPDISEKLLRTLGVKEGDILRVLKFLDGKFGRSSDRDKRNVSFADGENGDEANGSGGLFSGPGGVLRNNTRKGRPAPPVQTNDVVDAKAFEQKTDATSNKPADSTPAQRTRAASSVSESKVDGFEDNAWDVKPSRQVSAAAPARIASPPSTSTQPTAAAPAPAASAPAPTPSVQALTGSLGELSILMPAIQPEIRAQAPPQPQPQAAAQPSQPNGANQTLFDQVAAIKQNPAQQLAPPRVRPQAPQQQSQGGLIAPPPQRAASAPMDPHQSAFGPPPALQPQLTGFAGPPAMHTQVAPPGQSLQDLNNQRLQQQMAGYPQQNPGFQQQVAGIPYQQNGIMPQPTGYQTMPPPMQQPMQTGYASYQIAQPTGFQPGMQQGFSTAGMQQPGYQSSPFADQSHPSFQPMQSQPTGYNSFQTPLNPQATGINRFLPPAIQPTVTGFGSNQSPPPMPPMPPMPQAQPLVAQKTGPAPAIRFGVQPAKKLTPQPTGRANLAKASPQNPFGF